MSSTDLISIKRKGLESRQLQRRVRHLRFILGRNLDPGIMPSNKSKDKTTTFSLSFTLHMGSDPKKVLYQSEEIWNSVNPNWREFDPKMFGDQKYCIDTSCVLCVWVFHNKRPRLLIKWNVELSNLQYIGEQQRALNSHSLEPNTIIFGMFGGYFTITKEEKLENADTTTSDVLGTLLKVQQSAVKWTYQKNSLLRVHYMLKALCETKQQVINIQKEMQMKTTEREIISGKFTKKESLVSRIAMLREEMTIQRENLSAVSEQLSTKSDRVREREKDLSQKYEIMEQHASEMKTFHAAHISRREGLLKAGAQLDFRRRQLVAELSYIYPILEIPGKEYGKNDLVICSIPLPDSEEFFDTEEEALAVALGNTCHLVSMVAKFLDLPLRYPLRPMGSRSTVLDPVTEKFYGKLEREFPLHPKGKEKCLFHYGVFLLNKNISQLRYHCGMGTTDLRKTLPNLKKLFECKFGVKVIYKKDTDLLPHGFERQVVPRKGTASSVSSVSLGSSPKQSSGKDDKEGVHKNEVESPIPKTGKEAQSDKKESGLPNIQKHSQVHKFINRRGKKPLSKTRSAPDSSSSENLMEVPFEEILQRSNRCRTLPTNETGLAEQGDDGLDSGDTDRSARDGRSPDGVTCDTQNGNGHDVSEGNQVDMAETIRSFDALDVAYPRGNHADISASLSPRSRNIANLEHVVLENNAFQRLNYSRQLSDVLVIPEPFEIDHSIAHLQSQLGNRI